MQRLRNIAVAAAGGGKWSVKADRGHFSTSADPVFLPPQQAAPPIQLTPQQVEHFRTFGFIVLKQALSAAEVARVSDEFAAGLALKDPSERIAGPRRQLNWDNLEPHSPFCQSLLEDDRFVGAATLLLRGEPIGWGSNSNLYSGQRSPWHPDVGQDHPRGLKFTFYINVSGACRRPCPSVG
jgi:hypothetical protein